MKPTKKTAPSDTPVNIVVPNTIELKMQAILAAARAQEALCKAINGVNLQATISNNVIYGADTAISIK